MQSAQYSLKPFERDGPTTCLRMLARVARAVPWLTEKSGKSLSKHLLGAVVLGYQSDRSRYFI
jgi:hypothetical protein